MRNTKLQMTAAAAHRFLGQVPTLTIATDEPMQRVIHPVLLGDILYFHGGSTGEKQQMLNRDAVGSAFEVMAEIPSWFIDPERACPATTFYRSVQIWGHLTDVEDLDIKTQVMAALMARFQPEGRYAPIDPDDRRYRKALTTLSVTQMSLERVVGREKLGQHWSVSKLRKAIDGLWTRGTPSDLAALEAIYVANPRLKRPDLLLGPLGTHLSCAPSAQDRTQAAALLEKTYWWDKTTPSGRIEETLRRTSAHMVARLDDQVVGTVSAFSDGRRRAWICDTVVADAHRGQGVGKALMAAMLDHPAVRDCTRVGLGTRDAQSFYASLGFEARPSRYQLLWKSHGA